MKIDEKRRAAARDKVRTIKKAEILDWYMANSGGNPPLIQCEDKKSYRGIVLWWLSPPIPNIPNPRLVEEYLGDSWTLRIEPVPPEYL